MANRKTQKDKRQDRQMPGGQDKVRLGVATLAALSGAAAWQAVAATATLPIIARLVRAIDLTVNTTMDFGTLAMTAQRAGAATLDPEINRLNVDGSSSLSLAGGTPNAGRLMIRGAEFPVAISIEDATVKLTNGTATVEVGDFNLVTADGGMKMTFTPTAKSYGFTIPVGATIKTRPGQISGTYVGTTRIFASYQ